MADSDHPNCREEMIRAGQRLIPRSCLDCGLGPCKYHPRLPPQDPRAAANLDVAARNADGTYNGYRAMSWMSAVVSKALGGSGRGLTVDEVKDIWDKVKKR